MCSIEHCLVSTTPTKSLENLVVRGSPQKRSVVRKGGRHIVPSDLTIVDKVSCDKYLGSALSDRSHLTFYNFSDILEDIFETRNSFK